MSVPGTRLRWWLNGWRKHKVFWGSRRWIRNSSRLRLTSNRLLPPRMSSWCDLVFLLNRRWSIINEGGWMSGGGR